MDSEMVIKNLGLVHNIAVIMNRKVNNSVVDYDDLVSEGCIGLINATETFDPERGFQFSTYAYRVISGYIYNFLKYQMQAIRYPREVYKIAKAIRSEDLSFKQVLQRFKCTKKLAETAFECASLQMLSMDSALTHDEETVSLKDVLPSLEDFSTAHVDEFKSTLSNEERGMLDLTIRGYNKLEIAASMGIDYKHVKKKMDSMRSRFGRYRAGLRY